MRKSKRLPLAIIQLNGMTILRRQLRHGSQPQVADDLCLFISQYLASQKAKQQKNKDLFASQDPFKHKLYQ